MKINCKGGCGTELDMSPVVYQGYTVYSSGFCSYCYSIEQGIKWFAENSRLVNKEDK